MHMQQRDKLRLIGEFNGSIFYFLLVTSVFCTWHFLVKTTGGPQKAAIQGSSFCGACVDLRRVVHSTSLAKWLPAAGKLEDAFRSFAASVGLAVSRGFLCLPG